MTLEGLYRYCGTRVVTIVMMLGLLLSAQTSHAGASVGRVLLVEGNDVVLSAGSWLAPGTKLDVRNLDGKRVATIQVKSIDTSSMEMRCTSLTGGGAIAPGFSVHERDALRAAVMLEAWQFPVDIAPNPIYSALTSEVSTLKADRGSSFLFGVIATRRNGWISVFTGYTDFGAFSAWEMAGVGGALCADLAPDRWQLEVGGALSFYSTSKSFKWARPSGSYTDKLRGNSGTAELLFPWTYKGWVGLNYQLAPELLVFGRCGYYGLTAGFMDSKAPEDATSGQGYDIDKNWLEISRGNGGLAFAVGLSPRW